VATIFFSWVVHFWTFSDSWVFFKNISGFCVRQIAEILFYPNDLSLNDNVY
jgi:hypothetical protein